MSRARALLVTVVLGGMIGSLAFTLIARDPIEHIKPAQILPGSVPLDAAVASSSPSSSSVAPIASSTAAATSSATLATLPNDASAAAPDASEVTNAGPPSSLRVVGLGWETIAAAFVANGGRDPSAESRFRSAGIDLHLHVAKSTQDVEKRLARGGVDDGADVAIVPLPTLVASSERLRALALEAFAVVGFSNGREGIWGANAGSLSSGKLQSPVRLAGGADDSSLLFSLFLIDAAGLRAELANDSKDVKDAPFFASVRPFSQPDSRHLLATSADAPRLIPIVLAAPRTFIRSHENALVAFAKTFFDASANLPSDVTTAARKLATEPEAPEPAALVERLGLVRFATRAESVRALDDSTSASPGSLAALFPHFHRLLKSVRLLSDPAPSPLPLTSSIMTKLGAGDSASDAGVAPKTNLSDAGAAAKLLLVARVQDATIESLADAIVLYGSVFDSSTLRIATRPATLGKSAIDRAEERVRGRSVVQSTASPDGVARIEILTPP